jgi:hypothetical protein
MRGRGGFGGRPVLRRGRPLIPGRRLPHRRPGCLGLFFPFLIVGALALIVLTCII